jgi:N-acetylmuramic acid 6-phosphate (MurNAc-6-P) etherase
VLRAVRLTVAATGSSEEAAREALADCAFSVKVAIVMLRAGLPAATAVQRLAAAHGSVHAALQGAAP